MAMAGHDGCMKLARSLPSRLSLARGSVQTKAKIDRTKSRVGIFTRRPGPRAPTVHTHTTCRYTCKARRRRSGGMRRPAAGRRGSAGGPTLSGGEPRAPEALWQARRVGGKLRPAWRVGPVRVASGQRRKLTFTAAIPTEKRTFSSAEWVSCPTRGPHGSGPST